MAMKTKRKPKRIKRSHSSPVLFVFLGVVASLAATVVASRPDAKPTPVRVANEFDTVLIPTPTRTIARGEKLRDIPIINVKWPKSSLTGNYLQDISTEPNAVVTATLSPLIPIPVASISHEASDTNAVVDGIPSGMRAITVKVDAESAVEGWARSGNFVDVILIRAMKDAGLESQVIAENVRILSAGSSTAPVGTDNTTTKAPQTVTLLTSQEDGLKIKTAMSLGKLTFALRGRNDEAPTNVLAMNQRKLLGDQRQAPIQEPITGHAIGPDGRKYVLRDNTRWVTVGAALEQNNEIESSHE